MFFMYYCWCFSIRITGACSRLVDCMKTDWKHGVLFRTYVADITIPCTFFACSTPQGTVVSVTQKSWKNTMFPIFVWVAICGHATVVWMLKHVSDINKRKVTLFKRVCSIYLFTKCNYWTMWLSGRKIMNWYIAMFLYNKPLLY